MSYNQQLRSVFTDKELEFLTRVISDEQFAPLTIVDKRTRQSIQDKLAGAQTIRSSKTTPPSKL
jgi:hypothetical protein